MAITRSAWEQAQKNPIVMDAIMKYSMMEAGQRRVDTWLYEVGLYGDQGRVIVGVVAIYDDNTHDGLRARARVIIDGRVAFDHEEAPYLSFPSDHFKTKVLLVTGGTDSA